MTPKTRPKQVCHRFVASSSTDCIAFHAVLAGSSLMGWQSLALSMHKCIDGVHKSSEFYIPMRRTQDNLRQAATEQHSKSSVACVL
jgi:hypothetical protein